MPTRKKVAHFSSRYIPIRLRRQTYLRARPKSPAIMNMVYPRDCWGQVVVVDMPMLECLLLACGLSLEEAP